ncbi:MAG: aspartyl protease family protein [Steroidobacteraceae bacterium]|nr:aspartyl protease family protein [Steroidobacteraceae bacterium]
MRKSAFALLVAGLAPLVAAAGTSGTFEAGKRGLVLVPVSVNGGEARPFALDTAASHTVLDAAEFAALAGNDAVPAAAGAHAGGAHGSFAARPANVDSLSLWGAEQRGQFAALMTLSDLTRGKQPDFAGVLGLPFLQRYRLDLDYPQRRLVLEEQDGDLPPCDICDPAAAVPLGTLRGGLRSVPVTVNGQQMTALFDTGASRTIFNEAAIAALGLTEAGFGESIATASIALGSLPARDHAVARIDLPVFNTLGLVGKPALILGIDYLGAGRTVVDLQAGLVWFKPADD